ncbi:MCE family protein [Mycolicibacterium cosmeticum]|uniref:MCE family protein n=1 Tax=Mycolicibacterium cosmeticum TaxID=258533 RepID=UPI003204D19B
MADGTRLSPRRKRSPESVKPTWLGVIALGTVSVLIAASLFVKMLGIGYSRYTAEFLQAASLQPGNPVTVAGIEVGTVSTVQLSGDHVTAALKIRDDVALGEQTSAAVKITTVLGSRYLELSPDGPGSLPDRTITLAHTSVPYDLQSALQDATTTFEQVDADQFAQSLAVLGGQLDGMPTVLPKAMENLRVLSSIVAERRDQLGTLLRSTQRVANTLRAQQANLGSLLAHGQDLIDQFVARQATFHAMLDALTRLVDNLDKLVVGHRPMVDDMLANLHELTNMVGRHDDLFRNLLQIAPVPVRGLANATGFGPIVEFNLPNGIAVDSWMCAISGRAKQFGMIEYFKDCK